MITPQSVRWHRNSEKNATNPENKPMVRLIYHIVPRAVWEAAPPGPYRAESLATEGFIHCSNLDQVLLVANQFFADAPELVVLSVNMGGLGGLVRDEDVGTGERFPHAYGPIPREAIFAVEGLRRDAEGRWVFA
jgi:uncharacterized protein (DUF952 family)